MKWGMPLKELRISHQTLERISEITCLHSVRLSTLLISVEQQPLICMVVLKTAYRDEHVDGILISVCLTAVTDVEAVTETVINIHRQYKESRKAIHYGCQGGNECREAIMKTQRQGNPLLTLH